MYLLIILMIFFAIIIAFVFISGPKLGLETQKIIDETLNEELPELIKGKTGFALSNNIKIWYELIHPTTPVKGTIRLM